MINDLKFIVYSYFTLEEILIYFKNKNILKTKIIEKYFKILPNLNDEIIEGNLETVKYLSHYFIIFPTTLNLACRYGHLQIVKFIFEILVMSSSLSMEIASENGHLDVVKYLYESGIEPTNNAMNWAIINGHLPVVQYLFEIGIIPNSHILEKRANKYPEIAQFFRSKGCY